MTGMSMFGKMSVGVRRMTAGLSKRIRIARTTKVYVRLRANLTILMDSPLLGNGVHRKIRRNPASLSRLRNSPKPEQRFPSSLVPFQFMFDAGRDRAVSKIFYAAQSSFLDGEANLW